MFRRLFRGFFTVLGGLIGYEAFELSRYMLEKAGGPVGLLRICSLKYIRM